MSLSSRDFDDDVLTVRWDLNRTADEIWSHIVNPSYVEQWLGAPISFNTAVGGEIRIDHGDGYICRSIVQRVDAADYQFEATWHFPDEHEMIVEVSVRETGEDLSQLVLRHLGLGDLLGSYSRGWLTHLTFFEASLESTPLPFEQFWNLHGTFSALDVGG
ncbi:MAG: SRPBCC domain-containing protein [Ancrocorticia sp.]|uniref:SRPBCC domain-containing protein n=2 Tax=Ancrocorticia sp. TaxID=2593684 RepID=UPI003F923930